MARSGRVYAADAEKERESDRIYNNKLEKYAT